MVRKARSTSCRSWKFSSRTSMSTTSAPNERSAFVTPRAVASETSRSEPGPPVKTAIFLGKSPWLMKSSSRFQAAELGGARAPQLHAHLILPHDLHFGFQLEAALCARGALDLLDQREHVGRRR